MPKSVVELSEHANRIVNIVKARDGLKDKSAAIERVIEEYEEKILDPALRPEFVADVQRILKGKFHRIRKLDDLLEESR